MPGQKFVTKERITVRNLRIREDTAKVGRNIVKFLNPRKFAVIRLGVNYFEK